MIFSLPCDLSVTKGQVSPVMRIPVFGICENKAADQLHGDPAADLSAFVFATKIVQSLYSINLKFQASSHLLWLYSPEDMFSPDAAQVTLHQNNR